MLTEQVKVEQVDAALLPAGAVAQGGHASLGDCSRSPGTTSAAQRRGCSPEPQSGSSRQCHRDIHHQYNVDGGHQQTSSPDRLGRWGWKTRAVKTRVKTRV